jgi:tRNA nucleotidyltransferase (CCA-adding enzyme)
MSDYIFMLESRLNRDQAQLLAQMQQAAGRAQFHLFLAGGAIRDLLGGFRIRDLDFSVEGPALKLVKQLDPRLFTVVAADEGRQSAEVVFNGAVTAEISMCRKERYTKTGGQPEITRATIQEDLLRRDFTINAIALSLNPASRGLLLDPTNGLADIEHKELRVLHNYSFFDDPARMLRLVRLEARLKYAVQEKTRTQFDAARDAGVIEYMSPRSRLTELRQLAAEERLVEAVKALQSAGLLDAFEPHLSRKVDFSYLAKLEKSRELIDNAGQRVDMFGPFVYSLTRKLSPAERAHLRSRCGMKASEAAAWTDLESRAKSLQKQLISKQASQNFRLYKLLASQDPAVALFLLAFSPLRLVRERIKTYFTQLRPLARSVDDREVEAAGGVKRGSPKFAAAREAYLMSRLEKKVPAKSEAPKAAPAAP